MSKPYPLESFVPGFGTIVAIRSGSPRDYLLVSSDNVTTWLDELAIKSILEEV